MVREWLKLRGFYVLPVSLIRNGGAPALEGYMKHIIASDTLISKAGETLWAEIKTYQRATFNQIRQRYEHGVPIRLWNQYKEGQRISGIQGCLFILQLDRTLILEGKLDDIETGSVQTVGDHHPPSGPQIFFDIHRFKWYSLETLESLRPLLPIGAKPKTVRPWEVQRPYPESRQIPML